MKQNISLIIGIGYITFYIALAIGDIGTVTTPTTVTWLTPVVISVLLVPTFIFGYFAGKHKR